MDIDQLPFIFGSVYYRKSNPPESDWEKDYQTAAADGMNVFRHWFLWSAIERKPGIYYWDDYDRHMDLAARHGMKTIIAECIHSAPEWAFHVYRDARYRRVDGSPVDSSMRNSSVTGGFPGLCFDNNEVKLHAENFLQQLADRYKDHPGLGGYDLWNECNLGSSGFTACHCDATQALFREWLIDKYGSLDTLAEIWGRYGFRNWQDVIVPKQNAFYQECYDAIQFKVDRAYKLLQWRREIIQSIDPGCLIAAHGVADFSLDKLADQAHNAWLSAKQTSIYGYSRGAIGYSDIQKGNCGLSRTWPLWSNADMTRAGAAGKPFWCAEMSAGFGWSETQTSTVNRIGRTPDENEVRLTFLLAMAAGARGIFTTRWRPLLNGPLFGCLGLYEMDGSRTARSQLASAISGWANNPDAVRLMHSSPVKGDIGLLCLPEAQIQCYLQRGDSQAYAKAVRGSYQFFHDQNIQADYISLEQLDEYASVYLPYPVMLEDKTVDVLISWVHQGGNLISEGCPGYFGRNCMADTVQPGRKLALLFGVSQQDVDFSAGRCQNLSVSIDGVGDVSVGCYMQSYHLSGGQLTGTYSDGRIAAVSHCYGQGNTLLIGSSPGYGYAEAWPESGRKFADYVLLWTGQQQLVRCDNPIVAVRLHEGSGRFIWMINGSKESQKVQVSLNKSWHTERVMALWGTEYCISDQCEINADIPALDGLVLELLP